jgi:hypothetical protein
MLGTNQRPARPTDGRSNRTSPVFAASIIEPVAAEVIRLIGVYDADGTVRGELTYLVRARIGRAHCALCDITHGRLRERPDWRAARDRLPVPFLTVHRDELPDGIHVDGVPVVLAETTDGPVVVAERHELEECDGSPDCMISLIQRAIVERELRWQEPSPT